MSKKNKLKKFRKKEEKRMAKAYVKEHGFERHAYLEELGIKIEDQWTNFCDSSDKRSKKWAKERKKYGFDSRETWNLDSIAAQFLYERIRCYQDTNCIDTSDQKFEFEGKAYTQEEAMDYILENLKIYLTTNITLAKKEDSGKAMQAGKNAWLMWAEIFPAMWW